MNKAMSRDHRTDGIIQNNGCRKSKNGLISFSSKLILKNVQKLGGLLRGFFSATRKRRSVNQKI